MYEIFERLCKLHGITAYRFCKDTGVNASTISTWKKNSSLAGPELSKKVCDYFNVSLDYLMTGKETTELEETKTDYLVKLGDNEFLLELLQKAEKLQDNHDKDFILTMLDAMLNKANDKQ